MCVCYVRVLCTRINYMVAMIYLSFFRFRKISSSSMICCLTTSKWFCSNSSPDIWKLLSAQISRNRFNTPPTRFPFTPFSIRIWPFIGYFGCSHSSSCSYRSRLPTYFSSSSTNSLSKLKERFFCGRHSFWYDLFGLEEQKTHWYGSNRLLKDSEIRALTVNHYCG